MWNRVGLCVRRCYSTKFVRQALRRAENTVEAAEGLSVLKDTIRAAKSTGSLSGLTQMPQYQSLSRSLVGSLSTAPFQMAVECLQTCANHHFAHDPSLISSALRRCTTSPEDLSERNLSTALLACAALREIPEVAKGSPPLVAEASRRLSSGGCGGLSPIAVTNMVWAMATLDAWPNQLTAPLMVNLRGRLESFPFHSVALLLWSLAKVGVSDRDVFTMATDLGCTKGKSSNDRRSFLQLAWALVTSGNYSQPFFDMLSEKVLAGGDGVGVEEERSSGGEFHTPRTLSSVSWCLAKARHYRPDAMDRIADLSLNHLGDFNSQDLGNLAYAFGFLNHPRKDLLVAVANRFASDPELRSNHQAHANILWACLVADVYPEQLVGHSLSKEALHASDRHLTKPLPPKLRTSMHILQLHVALTCEHPELGLGTIPSETVRGFLLATYEAVMGFQQTSVFQRNVWRALERLGGGRQYYLPEALTRSGYLVDAELLLGPGNAPLLVPRHWYFRTIGYIRDIALGGFPSSLTASGREGQTEQQATLEAEGKEEEGESKGEEGDSKDLSKILSGMSVVQRRTYINLASDWHGTNGRVARRVAVEADGPEHFSINCNHPMGRTVLKHRQLRAMGWEVISIPYYEWAGLKTGDCHVQYLKEKLFMS